MYGGVQSGFKITEKGKYFLDEAKKMLEGKIKITKTYAAIPKRKEVTFINLLKKTVAYRKYIQGKKEGMTESDILESLKIPQGSKQIAEDYIKKYLDYAHRINDNLSIEFLEFVKKKLRGNKNA